MRVKLVTDAQVVTTRILPSDGTRRAKFELVLDVPHGSVADLFALSDGPDNTAPIGAAFLGVGERGGFSVCSMGGRGRVGR